MKTMPARSFIDLIEAVGKVNKRGIAFCEIHGALLIENLPDFLAHFTDEPLFCGRCELEELELIIPLLERSGTA